MKIPTLLFLFLLAFSQHALTLKEALQSRPVIYHPVIEEMIRQGEPLEFRPLGLKHDSLFYYLQTVAGGCGSEADFAHIRLCKQNIVTDSVSLIDSFTIPYHYDENNKQIVTDSLYGKDLKNCQEIFKFCFTFSSSAFHPFFKSIT